MEARSRTRTRLAVLVLAALALVYLSWPSSPAGPPLRWRSDLDTALADAARERRPVLLFLHASWCSVCRELEEKSLRSPEVARELERFVRVRIDAGRQDPATLALMERFRIRALPGLVFVAADGRILDQPRIQGYATPRQLAELLARIPGGGERRSRPGPQARAPGPPDPPPGGPNTG